MNPGVSSGITRAFLNTIIFNHPFCLFEKSHSFRVVRALRLAMDNLRKGYTTVRDLGDRNDIVTRISSRIHDSAGSHDFDPVCAGLVLCTHCLAEFHRRISLKIHGAEIRMYLATDKSFPIPTISPMKNFLEFSEDKPAFIFHDNRSARISSRIHDSAGSHDFDPISWSSQRTSLPIMLKRLKGSSAACWSPCVPPIRPA
mgnify:CR=1 FL=1